MGYGNLDALTKPIDILFALVHSTIRLLNSCSFSIQVCARYFLFSSLLHLHLHWSLACARNLVTQWKNPAGPTSSFLPVERDETYFVVPWMPSILLCIRWWAQNVCHDVVVVAWLTLPYSFHLDTTLFFATHTHTDQLYGNPCLFILSLPFIYLLPPPAFLFCFTILWWWVTLFDIHAPLPSSLPPHTRWWYPAFNSSFNYSHGLNQPDWLLSIWRGFLLIFKDRLSGL